MSPSAGSDQWGVRRDLPRTAERWPAFDCYHPSGWRQIESANSIKGTSLLEIAQRSQALSSGSSNDIPPFYPSTSVFWRGGVKYPQKLGNFGCCCRTILWRVIHKLNLHDMPGSYGSTENLQHIMLYIAYKVFPLTWSWWGSLLMAILLNAFHQGGKEVVWGESIKVNTFVCENIFLYFGFELKKKQF